MSCPLKRRSNGSNCWLTSPPIAICPPPERNSISSLRDGSVIPQGGADGQTVTDQLAAWNQNVRARENIVLAMALSPVPSTVVFPPFRTTSELQKLLAPGEALIVFHEAAGNLYGFLLSKTDSHVWQLENEKQVERTVTDILRVLGNFGPNREMGAVDLKEDKWPDAAAKAYGAIFGDARLDLSKTTSLVIVPDSWLWYMPFEMLVTQGGKPGGVLADRVPLHYGPTAALAIGDTRPFRRPKHTGIVASEINPEALKPLEEAVEGPLLLTPPLPQPGYLLVPLLDELVVLDNVELDRNSAYGWSPLPKLRGKAADSLAAWMGLPYEGPERVVLSGFPSAAENGLKVSRREKGPSAAPGSEMFETTCALMASGARTVLLTRWRTGGQTNLEIVREFVQELPDNSAAAAWQRSICARPRIAARRLTRASPQKARRHDRSHESQPSILLGRLHAFGHRHAPCSRSRRQCKSRWRNSRG